MRLLPSSCPLTRRSIALVTAFVGRALLLAVLEAGSRLSAHRLQGEMRVAISRLVLERIVYAEPAAFAALPSDRLASIAEDMVDTLHFFNTYLPSVLSGVGAFVLEGRRLLLRRSTLDPLALLYPVLIGLLSVRPSSKLLAPYPLLPFLTT